MITGNVIKFGYGDIAISANAISQTINFHQSKSSFTCGTLLKSTDELLLDKSISIKITHDDYKELRKLLDRVKFQNILEFDFKNYKFDFTKCNEESIKAFEQMLIQVMSLYFLTLAC